MAGHSPDRNIDKSVSGKDLHEKYEIHDAVIKSIHTGYNFEIHDANIESNITTDNNYVDVIKNSPVEKELKVDGSISFSASEGKNDGTLQIDSETKPGKVELSEEVKSIQTENTSNEINTKLSDRALEKENNPNSALEELNMRKFSASELEKTAEDNEHMFFRRGDGKTISYADAQREMIDSISKSLDNLDRNGRNISDEQKHLILADVQKALLSQQAESQSRGIGNHGITHLYGVYERMKDMPDLVLELGAEQLRKRDDTSEATAEDLHLGMVLAAIYHDEGYLSEQARRGVNNDNYDKLHGVDSAIAFENSHAEYYQGIVDSAVLGDITQAMAEHNVLTPKDVERVERMDEEDSSQIHRLEMLRRINTADNSELDPNENLIRSALLLSDKAAVDADEKVPDVLRNAETASIVTEYYTMNNLNVFSEEEKKTVSEEMCKRMRDSVLENKSLSESQKANILSAIEKDFGVNSGAFNMPLSGAAVSSDALKFSVSEDNTGKKKIDAYLTLEHRLQDPEYIESFITDGKAAPEAKKLHGAMEDLGIIENKDKSAIREIEKEIESGEALSGSKYKLIERDKGLFEVDTENVQGLSNVHVYLESVDVDSSKGSISDFEKVNEQTVEKIKEIHMAGKQAEINEKVLDDFYAIREDGSVTREDILNVCGAAYESEPEKVEEIVTKLGKLDLMDECDEKQQILEELADCCCTLRIKDPQKRLYDELRKGEL